MSLMLALALAAAPVEYAELVIRRSVVVRVRGAPGPPPVAAWRERKGPKCLPIRAIHGAGVFAPRSVDLILRGGARLRARFSDACPTLDYYGGFYILPTADGLVCADRDSVRTRAGGSCEIERFRRLVPRR